MKYFNSYEKSKIPFKYGKLDTSGVPLTNLKSLGLSNKDEFVYHPTPIIQYGIALVNQAYDKKANNSNANIAAIVEWVIYETTKNDGLLFITFDHKELKLKNPWVSGMTQGQALSLLVLSKPFHSIDINNAIDNIFKTFLNRSNVYPISYENDSEYFIEEAGNYKILNGFIYGLIGLIHYYDYTNNCRAKELIKKAQIFLHKHLNEYDLGWWSLYSLKIPYHIADKYYHQVHVKQLSWLGNYLDDDYLKNTAQKWQLYLDNKPILRYKLARIIYLIRYKFFVWAG